jgi:hypothetical protein
MTGRELYDKLERNGHLDVELVASPFIYMQALNQTEPARIPDPHVRYDITGVRLIGDLSEPGQHKEYVVLCYENVPPVLEAEAIS